MSDFTERLAGALDSFLRGDRTGIVDLLTWGMPTPTEPNHSSRIQRAEPATDGWVFREPCEDDTAVEVVLAPDGSPLSAGITWRRDLLRPTIDPIGRHRAFRLIGDSIKLELGPEAARIIVALANRDYLKAMPRSWSHLAQEAIREAVDADRSLLPFGPAGWTPGPSAAQQRIRDLLAEPASSVDALAARLADLLLDAGTPEADIRKPLFAAELSALSARFGDEVVLSVEWRAVGRTARCADATLSQPGTAFSADITHIAPALLGALRTRHRAFSLLPADWR